MALQIRAQLRRAASEPPTLVSRQDPFLKPNAIPPRRPRPSSLPAAPSLRDKRRSHRAPGRIYTTPASPSGLAMDNSIFPWLDLSSQWHGEKKRRWWKVTNVSLSEQESLLRVQIINVFPPLPFFPGFSMASRIFLGFMFQTASRR